MHHRQKIKAPFQQLVKQSESAVASNVQTQAGDETHWEYLEVLNEKDAMRLHCAFRHCSDKKVLPSLTKVQHPASQFMQIYQRTHMSDIHAIISTSEVTNF